jgi:hypothetical protein
VLLGLVLVPLVLEVGLRAAARFARPEARVAARLAPEPGERRILCIGDSHTYGSHLPAEEAYPGQLQRMLERVAGNPWRVVNLGFPGQNSAQVRLGLARNIALYRPELVLVLVGANNTWSSAEGHLWDHPHSEPPAPIATSLLERSRAWNLFGMVRHRLRLYFGGQHEALELDRAAGVLPGTSGGERGGGIAPPVLLEFEEGMLNPLDVVRRTLFLDLDRMRELCAQHGAELVLAEYPVALVSTHRSVNRYLREYAAERGVPFVPLTARMVPLGEAYGFPMLWFEDHHCKADANFEVARQFLFTLMDRGLVEETPELRAVESFEKRVREPGLVVVERAGRDVDVRLMGEPGHVYRIWLFALLREAGAKKAAPWQVNLARTDLAEEERKAYFGVLPANGLATLRLRLPEPASLKGMGEPGGLAFPTEAELVRWQLLPSFRAPDAPLKSVEYSPGADLAVEPDEPHR